MRKGFSGFLIKLRQRWQLNTISRSRSHTRVGYSRKKTSTRLFSSKRWKLKPRAILVLCLVIAVAVALPLVISALNANPKSQSANAPGDTISPLPTLPVASPTSIPVASPTSTPPPDPTTTVIKVGMTAPVVTEIQQRLMDLGYMDNDEPTDYFGQITSLSIQLFQRQHGLAVDGSVGAQTYTLLMSDEAQKYAVSLGAQGTDIKELQRRLRELGYMDNATGFFGDETKAAVVKFQQRNGLSSDGTVGEKTREMLYSEDAKSNYFEKGEVSEKLKTYQERLKKLGYLTTNVDGKYGDDTIAAVKRFQDRNALIADGYLGPETISLLMSGKAQNNALILGMKGDDVTNVQKRLKALNYMKNVTGYFGSETESAVRDFQKRNGLGVDGKVGKTTMSVLTSPNAKKGTGATNSGGSSGGSSGGKTPDQSNGTGNVGVEQFIAIAKSKLGCAYIRGAKGPSSFDCSGFVYWCLNQAGVKQGYMTSSGWQTTTRYQRISNYSQLQRGDIISFRGHVTIYLGNGQMIDASSSQGRVRITSNIWASSYWKSHFVAGFRVF